MKTFAALLLLITACGVQTSEPIENKPPIEIPDNPDKPKAKSTLAVWAAPWCGPCKAALPEIEAELAKVDASKINFIVYVISGDRNGTPCTQSVADIYAHKFAPTAKAVCDTNGKLYRQYKVSNQVVIPAGLVINSKTTVFKANEFYPTLMVQEASR